MNRTDRMIDQLCRDVIVLDSDDDAAPSLERMAQNARAILDARKPRRRTAREREARKPESVRVKEKVSAERGEREAQRKRVGYNEVRLRANGRCEVTGAAATDLDPLVIHHIVYGRGVDRDAVTRADLMIQVRDSVHKAIHADPLRYEFEMKEWAASNGLVRAWNEIERRCSRARAAAHPEEGGK